LLLEYKTQRFSLA